MANISDVAKKAGVGVSTVSKVLNGYAHVSQKTKDKVMAAVEELNYVPNALAAALSSKKGKRIAVVVFINNKRQAIDEINMQYLFGSFNQAQKLNLDIVTVFSVVLQGMSKQEVIQYFNSLRVEAIVMYGLNKDEAAIFEIIAEEHFKVVTVDAPIENRQTSYVMIDHQKAQYDITKLMIKTSPEKVERVLYLAGRRDGYVTDMRLQGVVDACYEAGVGLNAQYADFSELKAREIVYQYARDADIIVCASDLMAIGAITALKEMDIYRPVSGFDGIKLLGYLNYGIKTVKQDFYKIAQCALDEAKRFINNEAGRSVTLDYEITEIKYDDVIM